jgi:biopolymer transport protein ExbB
MLTNLLLKYTLGLGAEWVLWLLVLLGFANGLIMLERTIFYFKRRVDVHALRLKLEKHLKARDFKKAAELLSGNDSMEARVVLFALREWQRGEAAVHELLSGALATERTRYDRGLGFLGTIGNNAPFIGLFGTVLGIIGAFANLGAGGEASKQVMHAISEALIATGVGLVVAIPAVIGFNIFKSMMKASVAKTELLGSTLLVYIQEEQDGDEDSRGETGNV